MRIFHRFPIPKLSPYVERFWGWEAGAGEAIPLPTILPGTGAEIFFHYREPFRQIEGAGVFALESTHLLCVRRHPIELAEMGEFGFVAIRFRAGALHHFIPVPGRELPDRQPRASDLWGASGNALGKQVRGARCNRVRVDLLENFLLQRLEKSATDKLISTAASRLYRHCDTLTITALASQLDIGRRQLERRFLDVTGQTLVEVRRLSRFQKTARTLLLDQSARCADSALSNGYYDQSHFIREFQSLTSLSPLSYLKQARLKTHFYNTPRFASEKIQSTLSSC
ncbi:MAG TPA: helix-turn-helix transcriptional regulator [Noviherbaspirillum sp.]|uniref:helix-turn-helix domain-containing protein n=1 Tax=Noviherbaspirillum sp. TaxID=1926288 RepID=UPI002D43010A|nr:helix-turn-helix transcriptional regulator [Noviherbaspirillum sp.]HYD94662.1 helix-turn-helix transcriptional regulator [Noviherbaspirillum sp.]